MNYTLNCRGRLVNMEKPLVMGIVNATPDSFYADSRQQTEQAIALRVTQIVNEGGSIIDVGACSTRPGSEPVSEEEEIRRLRTALDVVRREVPEAVVSVDTFRPTVARMAVEEYGADIINDVGTPPSASSPHPSQMFRTVSRLRVPYIYMSRAATMKDVLLDCAKAIDALRTMGQKDIIVDPGFGFGKTMEQNYQVLSTLERLQALEVPILVGMSRKRMVYELLGITPDEALNGTTVLNTMALMGGASILRVHDVRAAVEAITIKLKICFSTLE